MTEQQMPARIWAGETPHYKRFWSHAKPSKNFPETVCKKEFVRADIVERMAEAMVKLLEMYVDGANSGDWGNWNPEEDKEVIAARSALSAFRSAAQDMEARHD